MTKRILVVEDNDLNRKLFCDVLKASGFAVEPVADGNDAIEKARSFFPNLWSWTSSSRTCRGST